MTDPTERNLNPNFFIMTWVLCTPMVLVISDVHAADSRREGGDVTETEASKQRLPSHGTSRYQSGELAGPYQHNASSHTLAAPPPHTIAAPSGQTQAGDKGGDHYYGRTGFWPEWYATQPTLCSN